MSVPAAYLGVVIIWSTTPLAIKWSGEEAGFLFGVAARMAIGLSLLLCIAIALRLRLPFDRAARKVYWVCGGSIYLSMTLVYAAAQLIPSGWLAVIFGLSPISTGLFSAWILKKHDLHGTKLFGIVLGFIGLLLVFAEGLALTDGAWIGVLMVIGGVAMQTGGAVWLKALQPTMSSLGMTTGGLLVATPLFAATFWLGQDWPDAVSKQTLYAIAYLGVFGSALGFTLYFYVLKNTGADVVALITMMTPVFALLLGAQLNGELISTQIWLGAVLILSGLGVYVFGKHLPQRRLIS